MSFINSTFAQIFKLTNMKKIFLSLSAVVLMSLVLFSCSSKSDPKDVARNFLNALTQMDYEGAKKYGTPETGKMLEMLNSFATMLPDSAKANARKIKIEIKDAKTEGDKCSITYRNSEKQSDQVLTLVKKDGKWLVDMSKDDSMNAGEDASVPEEVPAEDSIPATDSLKVDVK